MSAALTYEFPLLSKDRSESERTRQALIAEVRRGLLDRPRSLSPWMFYDRRGSRLFERITRLPEYYLTRTERGIFRVYADDIVSAARAGSRCPLRFVELGAGTASKTGILLKEATRVDSEVLYVPTDVSPAALDTARESISGWLKQVRVEPVVANYVTDPLQLSRFDGITLALYIGSSIGNFSPEEAREILRNLHSQLRWGDALLLGTDLVKEKKMLVAAYDDAQGVTAKFNLNVLGRLNRELDANFDLASFRHRAVWNPGESRMEMYLESVREQQVRVRKARLRVAFAKAETIHTENSYKFTRESIRALLEESGFGVEQTWLDKNAWYAVTLARVARA